MAVCCSHILNVVLVTANSEKAVLDSIFRYVHSTMKQCIMGQWAKDTLAESESDSRKLSEAVY